MEVKNPMKSAIAAMKFSPNDGVKGFEKTDGMIVGQSTVSGSGGGSQDDLFEQNALTFKYKDMPENSDALIERIKQSTLEQAYGMLTGKEDVLMLLILRNPAFLACFLDGLPRAKRMSIISGEGSGFIASMFRAAAICLTKGTARTYCGWKIEAKKIMTIIMKSADIDTINKFCNNPHIYATTATAMERDSSFRKFMAFCQFRVQGFSVEQSMGKLKDISS